MVVLQIMTSINNVGIDGSYFKLFFVLKLLILHEAPMWYIRNVPSPICTKSPVMHPISVDCGFFLQVRNGAGLVTVASTWGSILDSTPPDVGVVWDGPYSMPGESQDLDYWGHTSHLSAHWSPFTDPHSTVVGYRWAIGSCHGCSNIRPFTPVGLRLGKEIRGGSGRGKFFKRRRDTGRSNTVEM